MERITSYDDDIYAWSQEQAAALRALAATRRDLPNELDLDHVAEEIEDLGRSEVKSVESFLELLLRHLLKVASAPDAAPRRHWEGEIRVQHEAASHEFRKSMRQTIDLDRIWRAARIRADAALDQHGNALLAGLPERCPFSLDDLVGEPLDLDAALTRIERSRQTDRS